MTSLKQIIYAYSARGFTIKHRLADGHFECLRKSLEHKGIMLNTTARDEHVPEVKRYICTIKERAHATINTLPFEKYPHCLIVEIIYNTVFWLNCFPHKDGIHPTLSPRTIVMGTTINYDKHCRVPFSTYMQVHEQHNNSMASCTSGAIAFRPGGNAQGSYYFLNLHSGKCIICNNWTVLPMPNEVINTIHQLADSCNKYKGIAFTDKDGNIINDENDDNKDNIEITGVDSETYTYGPPGETHRSPDHSPDDEDTYSPPGKTHSPPEHSPYDEDTNSPDNEDTNSPPENTQVQNYEQNNYNNADIANDNIYTADDDVSIEGNLPDDTYVTIDDINIVREMNSAQLSIDPKTGEERDGEAINNTHQYNLRPMHTCTSQQSIKYT